MIKSFQTQLSTHNAYDIAFNVGKRTGLVAELFNDKSTEGLARYESIQELLNAIKEFTETPDEEGELHEKSLGGYLQQISLMTDVGKDNDENEDTVKLMTIHAAKGLEFPCVFSVGLEENLFPSSMSLYDRADLEEERRLFYVAVTRAKQRLWVTYAGSRYRFGSLIQNDPSRFLEEIPKEYLDQTFTGMSNRPASNMRGGFGNTTRNRSESATPLKRIADKIQQQNNQQTHTPSPQFQIADPALLQEGMKVEHQKFGFGQIQTIEGNINNRIATIDFGTGQGIKKIMLNYAKLSITE